MCRRELDGCSNPTCHSHCGHHRNNTRKDITCCSTCGNCQLPFTFLVKRSTASVSLKQLLHAHCHCDGYLQDLRTHLQQTSLHHNSIHHLNAEEKARLDYLLPTPHATPQGPPLPAHLPSNHPAPLPTTALAEACKQRTSPFLRGHRYRAIIPAPYTYYETFQLTHIPPGLELIYCYRNFTHKKHHSSLARAEAQGLHFNARILPSRIFGASLGLFTTVNHPARTLLGAFTGRYFLNRPSLAVITAGGTTPDRLLTLQTVPKHPYLLIHASSHLSYINHSFNPNCRITTFPLAKLALGVRTLRPLRAGEEITIDYSGWLPLPPRVLTRPAPPQTLALQPPQTLPPAKRKRLAPQASPVKSEPMTTWTRASSQNTITDYLDPELPLEHLAPSDPLPNTDPCAILGRRMVRTFDLNADEPNRKKRKTKRYYGTVSTFIPVLPSDPIQEKVWRVLYDDGQGEDLNWTELKPCLLNSTAPIPPPTHPSHITLSPARLDPRLHAPGSPLTPPAPRPPSPPSSPPPPPRPQAFRQLDLHSSLNLPSTPLPTPTPKPTKRKRTQPPSVISYFTPPPLPPPDPGEPPLTNPRPRAPAPGPKRGKQRKLPGGESTQNLLEPPPKRHRPNPTAPEGETERNKKRRREPGGEDAQGAPKRGRTG